jgi:SAM-dependent methyltransferase
MTTTGTARPATSRDPYARIGELDQAGVARLAERIETRARDPRQHQLWRDFLARADFPAAARVLEVGCGTGIITGMIANLPTVAEAVGADPSPHFVELARSRNPRLRFEVADGRDLPFPDGSFGGVVFATTLCHIPDPERALAEAHRVLHPGGRLLVYDGDYSSTTVALADQDPLQTCVRAAIGSLVHDPWLVRRLVPLLRAAGFTPGELHSHGYLETDHPTYLPTLVDAGADTLASAGVISPATAAALKAEARHRAEAGRFLGHIVYASLPAHRPQ